MLGDTGLCTLNHTLHLLAGHKHPSQTKEAMVEKGGGVHWEGFVLRQDCALGGWHGSVSCRDVLRSNLAGRTVWRWESSPKTEVVPADGSRLCRQIGAIPQGITKSRCHEHFLAQPEVILPVTPFLESKIRTQIMEQDWKNLLE